MNIDAADNADQKWLGGKLENGYSGKSSSIDDTNESIRSSTLTVEWLPLARYPPRTFGNACYSSDAEAVGLAVPHGLVLEIKISTCISLDFTATNTPQDAGNPHFRGANNTEHKVLKPTATFVGDVYLDMISADPAASLANITFTPCARTHWHTHEGGQMIRVISGTGWICDLGKEARRIQAGDVVWAPPGTTHWHGADDSSIMTHFVVGIGETKWHDQVTDEEYKARQNE